MFRIREAFTSDLDGLFAVARHLDTVNLPADRDLLASILDRSQRSFSGELEERQREFLFVLEDTTSGRVIGSSIVVAQHGTRPAPHVFFDVLEEQRYSSTLDRYFVHRYLRIGYQFDGPTEIGGLILLPEYRGRPEALGKLLSYVRFLYIAMHRTGFRDEVLSELLPPLGEDGASLLWESLGRHFTGLSYQQADRLSKDNKEFIRGLFPEGPIYVALLPPDVQAMIGEVGPKTRGVKRMLEQIGFEHAQRIDPFDGGPHYVAHTDEITLVRGARTGRVTAAATDAATGTVPPEVRLGLVASEHTGRTPCFTAVTTQFGVSSTGEVAIDAATRAALGVAQGDTVHHVAT